MRRITGIATLRTCSNPHGIGNVIFRKKHIRSNESEVEFDFLTGYLCTRRAQRTEKTSIYKLTHKMLTFLGSDFDWVSGKKERAPSLQPSQQSEQMSSFSTDLKTLLKINLFFSYYSNRYHCLQYFLAIRSLDNPCNT